MDKIDIENKTGVIWRKELWDKALILKEDWVHFKCQKCGGDMDLVESNDYFEVKQCFNCGSRAILVKKLKIMEDIGVNGNGE